MKAEIDKQNEKKNHSALPTTFNVLDAHPSPGDRQLLVGLGSSTNHTDGTVDSGVVLKLRF